MPKKKMGKRWFVAASGWGLNMSAGSSDGNQLKKRDFQYANGDVNIKTNNFAISGASYTHNTIYTFNPLAQITQGDGEASRNGAAIGLKTMSMRGVMSNDASTNTNNTKNLRVLLLASSVQSDPGATLGSGLGATDIFYNTTFPALYTPNMRLVKVLCDQVVELQPTIGTAIVSKYFEANCAIDQTFEFRTDASKYGTSANLYWVVLPYQDAGVSGTTQMGSLTCEFVTVFTD